MSDNTQRFTGRAADYQQFRERYDADVLLPRFRTWCGLTPQWIVADIGAGTGMLADIFLANGNRVLAVEPNAEMREACAALHANDPRLAVIDGTAEAAPLPAQSVDLISVGRSFHWFDVGLAIREFRRILKPDGWVVSVAAGRTPDGTAANVAVDELLRSFTNQVGNSEAYAKYARLPEFLARDYRHEQIEGAMNLTQAELFGLLRSISHAPLPGDLRFLDLERGAKEVFARHAVESFITLATRYWINVGRLSLAPAALRE